jgi:hypothetical protein
VTGKISDGTESSHLNEARSSSYMLATGADGNSY